MIIMYHQVPHYQKQVVQKHVPKIVETKVVEKVVPVPVNLVRETAVEVPKVGSKAGLPGEFLGW